jgi:hypothetical protein
MEFPIYEWDDTMQEWSIVGDERERSLRDESVSRYAAVDSSHTSRLSGLNDYVLFGLY